MRRVLIFGNSGSGKSTLARRLAAEDGLTHFDLDSIAWLPTDPPQRSPVSSTEVQVNQFISEHIAWVIEGCYADLIEIVLDQATELIFLNLSVDDCITNARRRPWEAHKYESKESQDSNLEMLIGWITAYPNRNDDCSLRAHQELYERFAGHKTMVTRNRDFG